MAAGASLLEVRRGATRGGRGERMLRCRPGCVRVTMCATAVFLAPLIWVVRARPRVIVPVKAIIPPRTGHGHPKVAKSSENRGCDKGERLS